MQTLHITPSGSLFRTQRGLTKMSAAFLPPYKIRIILRKPRMRDKFKN